MKPNPNSPEATMTKQMISVTAFEMVRVTRKYLAENDADAIERMSKWMQKQETEHGREFSGTVRIEPASK
jgi:hypothetical protein